MRLLLLLLMVAVAGCSGPARGRSPYAMMARRIPKAAKRIMGDPQAVTAADQPITVVTGNVVR